MKTYPRHASPALCPLKGLATYPINFARAFAQRRIDAALEMRRLAHQAMREQCASIEATNLLAESDTAFYAAIADSTGAA